MTIVFGALPFIMARPYVGILVWSWLGYMNPHRLTWGLAYDFPLAFVVAITTLVAAFVSRDVRRIPITMLTALWTLFIVWVVLTTIFAFYPDKAWIELQEVLKIQLMTFVTIILMQSRERMRMLIWVIVISLGYYGVKGGVFTIITGGDYRVWGPPSSMVEGNNELALALLMILPLMQFLRTTSEHKWIRIGLFAAMALCAFSIVGSQSRGAFVGGLAMALVLWVKSKHKLVTGLVLVIMIPALIAFMPAHWHERMETMETYQEDDSAMSRIRTWRMALNLASDNVMGGGFELWTAQTFDRYSPQKQSPNDAHSIYFKVLAEHGWFGLILFLGIIVSAWRTASRIIRNTRNRVDLEWLSSLARMCQVSLVAYATGGAFLSLPYFDLFWHLIAMLVMARELLRQHDANALREAGDARRPSSNVPLTIILGTNRIRAQSERAQ